MIGKYLFCLRMLPRGIEIFRRGQLQYLSPPERRNFQELLDDLLDIQAKIITHLNHVHLDFMPAEEVKPGERTLEKLHSSENLLKHFRMQSYDTGFAAGDSHFLSILNNLSDVSEAVKFHFETDSCSAPITLKTSVNTWLGHIAGLTWISSDLNCAYKVFVETGPLPSSYSSEGRLPVEAMSPLARIRTPQKKGRLTQRYEAIGEEGEGKPNLKGLSHEK